MVPSFVVAEDHPLFREAVVALLHHHYPDSAVTSVESGPLLIKELARQDGNPMVLLDLMMPETDAIETTRAIRYNWPDIAIIVVSAVIDPVTASRMIELGVRGYIPKTTGTPVIASAIELVLSGGNYIAPEIAEQTQLASADASPAEVIENIAKLTPRQLGVMQLVARGMSNKDIGTELGISSATVKLHVNAILRALDASNRTEAALIYTSINRPLS